MHHYTTWSILKQMVKIGAFHIPDDEASKILELACLLHDLKKSTPWNQLILQKEADSDKILREFQNFWEEKEVKLEPGELKRKEKLFNNGHTDHQIEEEKDYRYILLPYLKFVEKEIPFDVTRKRSRVLFDIIKHHFLKEEDISKSEFPGFGNYILILKYCDRLASMESVDINIINDIRKINKLGRQIFDITYFTVSREFGPSTGLIMDTLFQSYKKAGWLPLLYFEDGGVLVTKEKAILPDKTELVEDSFNMYLAKSLESLPLQYGGKSLLVGASLDHPAEFLLAHKDKICKDLSESDAGVSFFKILIEILDAGGYNTDEVRETYSFLDVLFGLTTGARGVPLAGKKWRKLKKGELPQKEGGGVDKRVSLNHIFNSANIEDVVPEQLLKKLSIKSSPLESFSSQKLFEMLVELAKQSSKRGDRDEKTEKYLSNIISMEEERDFSSIAKKRFEEYKAYKQKPQAKEGGVCELCGSTVTQKPGADFARGEIQAFTQIKAKADIPRKICPFCAYDNSKLRENLGTKIPIYAKIDSKIPLPFRKEIEDNIKFLKDGLTKIQSIENMRTRWGIVFPDVDIILGESDYDVIDIAETREGIEMVFRLQSIPKKEYSPKDQQAKYEPLYHLLNLLGFSVAIGREKQAGLFGETILTTEENYYKSLATILLSSTIDKKRRYIFAKDLLEKSPSVAITYGCQEEKGRMRLKKEFAKPFFRYLYNSGIILFMKGGEYKMKDLLNDAVFFATGIPKFCWDKEDWNKWRSSLSKHLITKPISQTLNEMLRGRDFEEAYARFLSNVRENIAKEKSTEAKTDVQELGEFVKEAKERLMRYYKLKQANITQFIRVKNALLSAVYVFKRYENLKEVLCDQIS